MINSPSSASATPTKINRDLKMSYILEPPVMQRIADLIRDEFAKLGKPFSEEYDVTFREARQQEFKSLDLILGMDNTSIEPISELELSFQSPDRWYDEDSFPHQASHSHSVRLRFLPDKSWRRGISLDISSSEPGWAESVLSRYSHS